MVTIVHPVNIFRAHFRRNMEDKTHYRLATELDIALMRAHLRLDITQVMDENIAASFQRVPLLSQFSSRQARNTLAIKPIDLLTRQLSFFQQFTAILAESWTLANMTPKRAWIMIIMSTVSPLANSLFGRLYYDSILNSKPL